MTQPKNQGTKTHIAAQDDWQFAIPFYPDDIMLEARYNYRFYFPLPLSNPHYFLTFPSLRPSLPLLHPSDQGDRHLHLVHYVS